MSVLLLYRMNTWLWESHVLRMEANMMASGTGAGSMDKVSTLVQPTSSTMDLRLQQEKCERPWCFGWWIRMCHFHTFHPGAWEDGKRHGKGIQDSWEQLNCDRRFYTSVVFFLYFYFSKSILRAFVEWPTFFGGRSLTIQGVCQWRQVRWMVVQRSM